MSFNNIKTIFLVIIIANVITQPDIKRADLCSCLINDRIYFSGGLNGYDNNPTSDFFYLDLAEKFDTSPPNSLPFVIVNNTSFTHRDSSLISSSTGDAIYLFLGESSSKDDNLVYKYELASNEWKQIPSLLTSGSEIILPKNLYEAPAITDGIQDIVYLYGAPTKYKMYTYNLTTNYWNSTTIAPTSYHLNSYGAIMLNDEILYIGGQIKLIMKNNLWIR